MMKRLQHLPVPVAATLLLASLAHGQLVFGPDAQALFEDFRDNFNGTFIDFETLPGGSRRLSNQFEAEFGVSFATIRNFNGTPTGPHNVYISEVPDLEGTIVGTPSTTSFDDARYAYEISFTEPQRWAGLLRIWNTSTITRFFDSDNNLLAPEHFNTVNTEFVGFIAQTDDMSQWISRIEIDGAAISGFLQVGHSDNLIFGVDPVPLAIPEPSTLALFGTGGLFLAWRRFQSRRRAKTIPSARPAS